MFQVLRRGHGVCMPPYLYFPRLVDRCLLSKCPTSARIVHAQLLKVGLIRNTFWGNRCLQLYFKSGAVIDAFQLFDDIPDKNIISWNVCFKGMFENGYLNHALDLFDEMPQRDVVSWNTMISGSASCGFPEYAIRIFLDMQRCLVRPTDFTFSILASLVSCARHGKQIHANVICSGVRRSKLVVWNSLMDMYTRLGVYYYALSVFLTMEYRDIISWNSFILSCSDSGNRNLALGQFYLMRALGNEPDEYTVSTVVSICSDLRDLSKGKQAIALCIKMGSLSNTIVSGAAIDMFSKCNRLEDSVKLFHDLNGWDSSPLCNSLVASYSWHGFGEDALRLFILAMRQSVRPDNFTITSVLSSMNPVMLDHGSQIHSMAIKLGFISYTAVATSLMEMYFKTGSVDSAMAVFAITDARDLIFWNTVVMGLARNSRGADSLAIFQQLLMNPSLKPDKVTLMGILVACSHAGFVDQGIQIFSSMKKIHGVDPGNEHYACIVELMCRAGLIKEAKDIAENMPFEPSSHIWEPILCASLDIADMKLAETVAERMLISEPKSSFPYLVLIKLYEMTWRWESSVRIRYAMNEHKLKCAQGSSKIGLESSVYSFDAHQLQIHGGNDTCSILELLSWYSDDNKIHLSAQQFH